MLCLADVVSLMSFIPIGLDNLSASFSAMFPEPQGERFDGDNPFKIRFSKFSHALHNVQLYTSV